MVLSDFLGCVAYPCHPFKIFVHNNTTYERVLMYYVTDDNVFDDCYQLLDHEVICVDFNDNSVLVFDKTVHT